MEDMEIEGAILSPEAAKRKVSYTDFGRSDFFPLVPPRDYYITNTILEYICLNIYIRAAH